MNQAGILLQPLSELGVSMEFLESCEKMKLETIQEILSETGDNLRRKKGFSYRWMAEFIALLSKHQLEHLLQPLPGSNAY
jgi:hypothetical protein